MSQLLHNKDKVSHYFWKMIERKKKDKNKVLSIIWITSVVVYFLILSLQHENLISTLVHWWKKKYVYNNAVKLSFLNCVPIIRLKFLMSLIQYPKLEFQTCHLKRMCKCIFKTHSNSRAKGHFTFQPASKKWQSNGQLSLVWRKICN